MALAGLFSIPAAAGYFAYQLGVGEAALTGEMVSKWQDVLDELNDDIDPEDVDVHLKEIGYLPKTGEAGGRLEEMLARSASGQEREVDGLIAALLGILQPLLIVAIGAIVMVIVLAILLPIFEINNLIL